ncbi:Holliday junction resolvase RuvX [Bernardetia sp.]|uniref:Holliday junction resolvase RuvX n=1 Tax=Bernardetia sp. TaxID=1937974 RepID=UPI0025C15687|nr:Holliday junction resolvase RuvX [Bernardetia sp.]
MGRLLAIDYGQKRVGLAVSDNDKIIATALETVAENEVLDYLKEYVEKENVEIFVLGMPKRLDNSPSSNAAAVEKFQKKLETIFPDIPISLEDERFTSSLALDAMISGGMSKKNRRNKANVDKISAVLILQTYMERTQSY